MSEVIVREARIADVKPIHAILMGWANRGRLLPRSLSQLYASLRDFVVLCVPDADGGGRVIGCCALSLFWEDLAEVRSLAIESEFCHRGYGRVLLDVVIGNARSLGLQRLFSLTYQVDFFQSMGFEIVSKDSLPQKVWSACINCPRFPDCDEIAVMMRL